MMICLFCENNANSPEHIFPDWYNRRVPTDRISKAGVLETWYGMNAPLAQYSIKRGKITNRTVRVVCESCNTGWMSRIEDRSSRIFKRLLTDEIFTLDENIINTIAAWAHLKLMISDALPEEKQHIPKISRIMFAKNETLLANTCVYLGRYIGMRNNKGRHIRDLAHIMTRNPDHSNLYTQQFTSQNIIYVMGNIVILIAWSQSEKLIYIPSEPIASWMPKIWPFTGTTYQWPRAHIGDETIEYLATALKERYPTFGDTAFYRS